MTINKLKFKEFFEKIESAISSVIMEINLDNLNNWDENYITLEILKQFRRNFRQVVIQYSQNKFIQIKTNFVKFNRKLRAEEKYGDIAILIKLCYDDGIVVEGVGLIEAKRIYKNYDIFSTIKTAQLNTIHLNAPHAYLMLYDYDRIDDNENFKNYLHVKTRQFPKPLYAALLPVNLALKIKNNNKIIWNREIYRFCTSFSYQFTHRYMYGLDLEFSEDIIKAAKGYEVVEKYPPQYIIQISVKHTTSNEQIDLTLPEVNSNNFIELDNIS